MGIDLTKLTEQLLVIANKADCDGDRHDGFLLNSDKEISIFKEMAEADLKNGVAGLDYTQDDINKVLGLEKSYVTPVVEPSKADKNVFEDDVKKLAKSSNTIQQFMDALEARCTGERGVAPEKRKMLADAKEIFEAVKATNYQTKDDVDKIRNTVKKQLKSKNKYSGVNKDILNALVKLAEQEVKNREFKALVDKFEAVLAQKSNKSGDNYQECLNAVEAELKKSGTWKKSYTKEAFKMLEVYARDLSSNTNIQAMKNEYRGIGGPNKEVSQKQSNDSKRVEKLIQVRKDVDARIKEMKTLTKNDIQDKNALGKELTAKLAVYINDHTDPETGLIDLSELVTDENEGIIHHVSDTDRTMNRNYEDEQLDERHWTAVGLSRLTGANITDEEAQKIAEFAKIPVQKKSHSVVKATKKNLPVLASGAITGATWAVFADQKVSITAKLESASAIVDQLGSKAKIVSDDGVNAKIVIEQIADLKAIAALGGAFEALATSILMDVIFGMKENEKTCYSTLKSRQYKTLEALEKHVKSEYPDKAQAIMVFAQLPQFMTKDGKWNPDKFYDHLDEKVGGRGSVINHDECLMADMTIQPEEEKPDGEKFKVSDPKVTTTHVDKEVPSIPHGAKYLWSDLTKIYSCFDGMPQLQATRMLEVIQAIDPDKLKIKGQYDIDRIHEIVLKAFKANYKPDYAYINNQLEKEFPEVSKATLKAVLAAGYPGTADKENKVMTPEQLFDASGNVACARDLTKLKSTKATGKGSAENNVSVKIGYGEDTITRTTTIHYYIKENGKVKEVSQDKYDASPYKERIVNEKAD